MKKRLLIFFFAHIFYQNGISQSNFDKNYFSSPIDFNLALAGNFGELRNNHFHAGIDIRTQNKEGLPIYAVADGYVSRIKISPAGYGKALYITHPNGYVSVYAHLKGFNDTIGAYVKSEQYKLESFAIDVFPQKNRLLVKKGDVVAISGNTGSSSGPHLHFEIREEQSEKAVNPQLWGFSINDSQKPIIQELAIYPLDIYSRVNNKNNAAFYKIIGSKTPVDTIKAVGKIGIGINGYDTEGPSSGRNGIFSIELLVNDKKIYSHFMDKIGFDETRYINCHVDYPTKVMSNKFIQRSFLLKNNKLGIYKDVVERGIIDIKTDSVYKLQYFVKDIAGNTSKLSFYIKGAATSAAPPKPVNEKHEAVFHFSDTNKFETADIKIMLPPDILYEDIRFFYKINPTPVGNKFLTPMHSVHKETTPLHNFFSVSIRCPELAERLKEKAYIIQLNSNSKRTNCGGTWDNGFIKGQSKNFGNFAIAIDTIAPYIKPENIYNNKTISSQSKISFKIGDDQTGIKEFRGTIDGKWVLFEYDAKTNRIYYEKDSLPKGKHKLYLEVKDDRNNISVYSANFIQ